jgi:hypothetical protein
LETWRTTDGITRDPLDRRKFAGDPWRYFREILGIKLTQQQSDALEVIEKNTRVLIPAGHDLGKTLLIAGYGLYVFDAVASIEDEDARLTEQGARVLLPGPTEATVRQTIYAEMLSLAARAEARDFRMPGVRSEKSVHWPVRAKWNIEALTPPKRVGESQSHAAGGRHHRNQIALIEEGQGVDESLWRAAEGMCSSHGNKIVSSFNPTEARGPAYQRAQSGAYAVIHLDAFEHPNVKERRLIVPAAIDFKVVDAAVRTDCRERGPYPGTPMEPEHGDFAYALPPALNAEERGSRADGIVGHPDGVPRVFRPSASFIAQKRGRWPTSTESGLFDAEAWSRAVARSRQRPDPSEPPDRVGVDPAREGSDDPTAAPCWGEAADTLLRGYFEVQPKGEKATREYVEAHRARIGPVVILPKGKGPAVALQLHRRFPRSPFVVDEGGVGTSPLDHLTDVLRRDAAVVSFAATPLDKVGDAEPWCTNIRTQLYVRLAMLVVRDLIDLPDDEQLREEIFAHELVYTTRSVELFDKARGMYVKRRVESVALIPKEEIKKRIGRSPDRADAVVLSVFADAAPERVEFAPSEYATVYG